MKLPNSKAVWQIHLSTAVVVMLTAGVLLYFSATTSSAQVRHHTETTGGWPLTFYRKSFYMMPTGNSADYEPHWDLLPLFVDALIGLAISFVVGGAMELLFRIRKK